MKISIYDKICGKDLHAYNKLIIVVQFKNEKKLDLKSVNLLTRQLNTRFQNLKSLTFLYVLFETTFLKIIGFDKKCLLNF